MTSPDETGIVVDTIIIGGKKFHGRTVSIISEFLSDERKLRIWGEGTDISPFDRLKLHMIDRFLLFKTKPLESKQRSSTSPSNNIESEWRPLDFPRTLLEVLKNFSPCWVKV
jgi:hypothetical protein